MSERRFIPERLCTPSGQDRREKVLNVAEERWKRALDNAFRSRRLSTWEFPDPVTVEPFVLGPSLRGPGDVVLHLDGFDLHELYTCLVDRDGPEGCCAGCTRLPRGWCVLCDREWAKEELDEAKLLDAEQSAAAAFGGAPGRKKG